MSESRLLKYAGCILVGIVVIVVVVTVVLLFVGNNKADTSDLKGSRVTESLKFIVVISRHGNRVAHVDYPNDPYPINDSTYWPYGEDDLTPVGRVEMYSLGVKIRSLYNKFLNSTFHPEEVHASSTYMDRMLMSGEVFLAGLYPPKGFQVWNKDIAWQPSAIYSDSPDKTVVINDCYKYQQLLETSRANYFATYATNLSAIVSYYNNVTGSNDTGDTADIFNLWDKLVSEDTEGYAVPDWTTRLYPEPLKELIAEEYIAYYAGTDEMVRLLVGSMFREIVEVMEGVTNGTLTDQRLQYYSGHDSSIVSLQVLLGIPKTTVIGLVKPGSAMILELHYNSTSDQHSLQTLYIDGSSDDLEPQALTIPGCGDPCDFPTLINNTLKFTDIDYDLECLNTTSNTLYS